MRALLALFLIATASPAAATTWFEEKFTCPIGGEKFTARVVGSNTTFGSRPDGKSYSPLPIYPITECPKNGLLLFDEKFSPADLAILEPAIASAEYQAMRAAETPRYRVWWLMKKLGRDPYATAWQLMQASWESDGNFDRKVRYQAAYIAAATALKPDPAKLPVWGIYQARAANALRELGHFDKALELIDRIDKPEYLPAEADNAKYARQYLNNLRVLIGEKNPFNEPVTMVEQYSAARRCELAEPPLSPSEVTACAAPDLAEPRKQARKWVEEERKQAAKAAAESVRD